MQQILLATFEFRSFLLNSSMTVEAKTKKVHTFYSTQTSMREWMRQQRRYEEKETIEKISTKRATSNVGAK